MWLIVLRLGPVNDLLQRVPLIDVQTCDFLDALTSQHDELDRAWIGGMDG